MPNITPLPLPLRAHGALGRWIWTLYRDHPNVTETVLVAATGAQQAQVSRERSRLLQSGMLTNEGGTVRVNASVLTAEGTPGKALGLDRYQKDRERLDQRCYQVLKFATQQAQTLHALDGQPHHLFHVRVPINDATRATLTHGAQGSVFVVAQTRQQAQESVQRERDPHIFNWSGPEANRPQIQQAATMDAAGHLMDDPEWTTQHARRRKTTSGV